MIKYNFYNNTLGMILRSNLYTLDAIFDWVQEITNRSRKKLPTKYFMELMEQLILGLHSLPSPYRDFSETQKLVEFLKSQTYSFGNT